MSRKRTEAEGVAVAPEVCRRIRRRLLGWYDKNARDLPWRKTRDPYRIWLSEILLQQTRVEAGTPYYERFVAAFPTVQDLARASEQAVLKLWEGLGYYTRARNLRKGALHVVDTLSGAFPTTAEEWRKVPGVGRYTAGAIASIAFGESTPLVDGNVTRVLARCFAIEDRTDATATVKRLWALAGQLVPKKRPGDFNQALMELGARICLPRRPQCDGCPLGGVCLAFERGLQEELPVRKPKKAVPHKTVVAGYLCRKGKVLLARRPEGAMLAGLWEYPGGVVKEGESHAQALRRVFREELSLTVEVGALRGKADHVYSHFSLTLHLYDCEAAGGRLRPGGYAEAVWTASPGDYPMPGVDRKIIADLTGK